MARHTADAGTLFTSLAFFLSAVNAAITIGALSSPIEYTNATGISGTTLVPFSVTLNSIPADDWNNVTYLNALRSSDWNWGLNVSESSDATSSTDSTADTQSIITLTWPEGDGPEVTDSPFSYCALYIPEMGDSLLAASDGNCADNSYGECEKAVITYLYAEGIMTDTHFSCSGSQKLPVPTECATAFGSNTPTNLTMYASNSMSSGDPFISRTDSSQSLSVGTSRPFEVILFELAQEGSERFAAAAFINCFTADTTVAAVLASSSSSSSSSSHSGSSTSSSSSASISEEANALTESGVAATPTSAGKTTGTKSASSTAATTTGATPAKQSAMGGLGAASSFVEGLIMKIGLVVAAYAGLLTAGLV